MGEDEINLKIIECLLNGISTDIAIAKEIKLSRSAVQKPRTKLQKLLNENLSIYRRYAKNRKTTRKK